jgi:hypothetical protein
VTHIPSFLASGCAGKEGHLSTLAEFLSVLRHEGIHLFLEEGQLRYRALRGSLTQHLAEEIRTRRDEIVAELIRHATPESNGLPLLRAHGLSRTLPIWAVQAAMLVSYTSLSSAKVTHMWSICHLEGALDVAALKAGIAGLRARHSILRSHFVRASEETELLESGKVWAALCSPSAFAVQEIDLRREADPKASARRLAVEMAGARFDIWNGPLMRAAILRVADREHIFVLVIHHAILDHSSREIVEQELAASYAAIATGRTPALPELPYDFWDYAAWRRELETASEESYLSYWRQRLSEVKRAFWLPTRTSRAAIESTDVSLPAMITAISADTVSTLRKFADAERTTMAIVVAACYCSVLSRWSKQESTLVWVLDGGRLHPSLRMMVGCLVNLWILRTELPPSRSFVETLRHVRDVYTEALDHLQLPGFRSAEMIRRAEDEDIRPGTTFNYVVQKAGLPRVASALPGDELPGAAVRITPLNWIQLDRYMDPHQRTGFAARFVEGVDSLSWFCQAPAGLFEEDALERFSENLKCFIEEVSRDPSIEIGRVVFARDW